MGPANSTPSHSHRISSAQLRRDFPSLPTLHLSPIREASSLEEMGDLCASYDEAMTPLTFLPDVDSVPLTPASREILRRPEGPFAHNSSVEDLAFLAGASVHSSFSSLPEESGEGETMGGLVWQLLTTVISALADGPTSEGDEDVWEAHVSHSDEDKWRDWDGSNDDEAALAFGTGLAIGPTEPPSMWD